ncbi:MAG: right-handed parallel beta-helix repeat-containing protein [Candidatus Azobacteroides sp.]|nr:right-handed parallel beta-helix repeat-containing protein [Candidatus Azobacteroides sp.]
MKKKNFFGLAAMLLGFFLTLNAQNVYHVTPDGTATADGLSWENATTLQHAIEQSAEGTAEVGDVILIKKGTYTAPEVDGFYFDDKNVTLYGNCEGTETLNSLPGYTDATVIETYLKAAVDENQEALGRVMTIAKRDVTLMGLDLSGGDAMKANISKGFGGVIHSEANKGVIKYCKIHGGSANSGAGIYLVVYDSYAGPHIDHCEVYENESTGMAGGIYVGNYVLITNCIVRNNMAETSGAGIYNNDTRTGTTTIFNCIIKDNIAKKQTGGAFIKSGYLVNSLISGNSGGTICGGVMLDGSVADVDCHIVNCTVVNNTVDTGITTDAGGVRPGEGHVYNCIIWGNLKNMLGENEDTTEPMESDIFIQARGDRFIGSSTVKNSFYNAFFINPDGSYEPDMADNIEGTDPFFLDDTEGDFRLHELSMCINKGNNDFYNNAVKAFPTLNAQKDLKNQARIVNSTIDMGAYEYTTEPLSIKEQNAGDKTMVYSSGKGILTVEFDGETAIYDIAGKMHYHQRVAGSADFKLPGGIYLVKLPAKTHKVIVY